MSFRKKVLIAILIAVLALLTYSSIAVRYMG